MKKTILFSLLFIGFVVFTLEVITKPSPDNTVQTVRITTTNAEKETLIEQIQSYADQHNIEAIDAKVDRVWKAIPGYNGLAVDIDASYLNMKKDDSFDEEKLVYSEVPPQIHLSDLPPSPIYRGNPEKPMVALLINVAWGNEFIPPILRSLENNQVKATFFFDGSWVKKNPVLAVMIYKEGHEIGNHAYSHPNLEKKSPSETMEELQKTNAVIEETIDVKPKWFAPPSGSFNQETILTARKLDMLTILWTVDTVDWRNPPSSEMVKRVVSEVSDGSMILMHPTSPTAEGLEQMIKGIKNKGYVLGTVTEIMSEDRIISK